MIIKLNFVYLTASILYFYDDKMNDLKAIVSTFSHEEQQRFVAYLGKKNKRKDTKNIVLFKHLLHQELSSKDIFHKIYKSLNENAYHALRRRLYQSIIDFIASMSLQEENSSDMEIIKYILAARQCFIHKQHKIAFKILTKAEHLAQENLLFALLNEIYHTQIQYAYTNPEIPLNHVIEKFKTNQKKYIIEDELNMVYAKIRLTLKNINFNKTIVDFQLILNQILAEQNITINESMSFKSMYQLMSIVGLSAFTTNNLIKTEPFLINTYTAIINHKNKENSVYYHIQILYLIANTLFRNKKFDKSQYYLNLMLDEMNRQKKKYYNNFKPKYNLLLALNLNYTNHQNEAIAILESSTLLKQVDIESLHDIQLSLIMCLFQKKEHKKAYNLFSKLNHTDKWYHEKIGKEWAIKKSLIEILLLIELEYINLVESRLLSFKRSHSTYLRSINQHRVITYLNFIDTYYKYPEKVTSDAFKNKVAIAFVWVETYKEDLFVMSFYSWLKGKMNKTDLYETTLQLINQARKELTSR